MANSWVLQALTSVRGSALRLHAVAEVTDDILTDAIRRTEGWDLEFIPRQLAFVERVRGAGRPPFEFVEGGALTIFGQGRMVAPESTEHFAVSSSTDKSGYMRRLADLATRPETRSVVATAFRVPDLVVMGPSFTGPAGEKYALLGLKVDAGGGGVLVGLLNLSEFYRSLVEQSVPEGIVLRLWERDNEAHEQMDLIPASID